MEEFKIVMQIMYKENKYLILLNSKHQKYFLKILDDEKFMYPTLEEFTELSNIFKNNVICSQKRRIGDNACIVEVGEIEAVDIDEQEDFIIADAIYNYCKGIH